MFHSLDRYSYHLLFLARSPLCVFAFLRCGQPVADSKKWAKAPDSGPHSVGTLFSCFQLGRRRILQLGGLGVAVKFGMKLPPAKPPSPRVSSVGTGFFPQNVGRWELCPALTYYGPGDFKRFA